MVWDTNICLHLPIHLTSLIGIPLTWFILSSWSELLMVCEIAVRTFSLVVADGSQRDSGIPWKMIFPSSNLSSSKLTLLFKHLFSCSTFSILSCSSEFFVLISWHSLKLVSQIFLNSNSISRLVLGVLSEHSYPVLFHHVRIRVLETVFFFPGFYWG